MLVTILIQEVHGSEYGTNQKTREVPASRGWKSIIFIFITLRHIFSYIHYTFNVGFLSIIRVIEHNKINSRVQLNLIDQFILNSTVDNSINNFKFKIKSTTWNSFYLGVRVSFVCSLYSDDSRPEPNYITIISTSLVSVVLESSLVTFTTRSPTTTPSFQRCSFPPPYQDRESVQPASRLGRGTVSGLSCTWSLSQYTYM